MSGIAATLTEVPTFADVLAARRRIRPYLAPTPLHRYPALDELVGTETWVKHENHQPICAFKIRGGINLLSQLTPDERRSGVITASTGNHGQSIAYAASLFGVRAIICVPEGANPVKRPSAGTAPRSSFTAPTSTTRASTASGLPSSTATVMCTPETSRC